MYEKHYLKEHVMELGYSQKKELMQLFAREQLKATRINRNTDQAFYAALKTGNRMALHRFVWFAKKLGLSVEQLFARPEPKRLPSVDAAVPHETEAAA